MRILVTAALPYSNGPIHLGHIAGAYLPADIFYRFVKLKGYNALYICGSDQYGSPIELNAIKLNIDPKDYASFYRKIQEEIFKKFNIKFDIYSGTAESNIHPIIVKEFFLSLFSAGLLIEKEQELPYDPKIKRFLPDRFVVGQCPYCGYEKAYGDQCEKCGRLLEPKELINPKSAITGEKVIFKKTRHLFFNIPKLKDKLKQYIESKKDVWNDFTYSWSLALLDNFKERAITRDNKWGVKVPAKEMLEILKKALKEGKTPKDFGLLIDSTNEKDLENHIKEYENKVLYVWFDAPIGYISFTFETSPEYRYYWDEKEKPYIVHFIGKDNIPFHTIFWPALIIGRNLGYKNINHILDFDIALPYQVFGNPYLNYYGKKFSKSKRWGVFLDNIDKIDIDIDYFRFYLAYIHTVSKDMSFEWDQFKEVINKELVDNIGNFIHRVLTFIYNRFNGIPPKIEHLDDKDKELLDKIKQLPEKVFNFIWKGEIGNALREIVNTSNLANKYFQEKEPWKTNDPNTIAIAFEAVKTFIILLYPFIPEKAKLLASIANIDIKWDFNQKVEKINKPFIVFHKLSDNQIEMAKQILTNPKEYDLGKKKVIGVLRYEDELYKIELECDDNPWVCLKRELDKRKIKYIYDTVKGDVPPHIIDGNTYIYLLPALEKPNLEKAEEEYGLVSYLDFAKLDMRVGKIIDVQDHPNADKLYIIKVSLGNKQKTLVGGLKQYYKKEELIGKYVVLINNLKPKQLRGITSEGMLLAADDGKEVALLMPDKPISLGSKVR